MTYICDAPIVVLIDSIDLSKSEIGDWSTHLHDDLGFAVSSGRSGK